VTAAPMRVVNPATGEVLREVAEADRAAVAGAFQRARAAQPAWAATPLAARCNAIRRFRALAVERAEALARTLALEVGKPITQARSELAGLLPRIDFFLAEVDAALADEVVLASPADRLEERIRREPLGVVANVSAWNYPWYVGANVFLPALLTGNAVLYKPSELATLTGLAIAELLHEAGIPADVFQALVGGGEVGAMLLAEPVDAVCFTGSHATGVKVAAAVAPRLVKVQLELGGKDPAYVCDDVDAAAAAAAVADGAFYNTGQSCCAVERAYVHERVWARFVDAFVETVRGWVAGDPLDARTYLGPLARREAALGLLEAQVADAVARGARVLTGGRRLDRPGFFFAPTVLVDVDHTMRVMREETFGPLVGLARVGSDDEAVALIQRALKIDPANPSYLDSLGWAYVQQGHLDLADQPLTAAADRLPKNSVVQDHLGDLRQKQHRPADAIAAWQRALAGDGEEIDRGRIEKKIKEAQALLRK